MTLMEDLELVTRVKRSGLTGDAAEPFRNRYFAVARLPRFRGRVRGGPIDPRGSTAAEPRARFGSSCRCKPCPRRRIYNFTAAAGCDPVEWGSRASPGHARSA